MEKNKKEAVITNNKKMIVKKIPQYILAVIGMLCSYFIALYLLGDTPSRVSGRLACPMDYGLFSAHWFCTNSDLINKLTTGKIPAIACSIIVFILLFPKTTKYHKLFCLFLLLAVICNYCYGGYLLFRSEALLGTW